MNKYIGKDSQIIGIEKRHTAQKIKKVQSLFFKKINKNKKNPCKTDQVGKRDK